jgi:phthiocerol/phenolphthiocerol synthesis type-I polyketide synthase E
MEDSPFIAVIGASGRFPGARDLEGFWANLAADRESVTSFGTGSYGVIPDADAFDAAFFGYAPAEALILDPQHRVFMECAWEALEIAGYDPAAYPGPIGVYAGCADTSHAQALQDARPRLTGMSQWQLKLAAGADFLTSRTAYKLGLTGPAITVQTACSTSLVAVHLAAQALLAGECDIALAGGVTVHVPTPVSEFDDDQDGVLSADGHCRAFDAAANGAVPSDGAGVVVLKRLDEAIADRDHVSAIIRGSAVTNDGAAKVGFTAPGIDGQAAAIRAALTIAEVDPATVSYVEAHGTGTPVGDPIEVRALAKAFGAEGGTCLLGSVKTSVGHTDAAAGVIGLIKVVLALEHELIPATLHFREPNPEIDFAATRFEVCGTDRRWPRVPGQPRRAGVNSLGIGGTNAHVIVEEAPAQDPALAGLPLNGLPLNGLPLNGLPLNGLHPHHLLVLSARTPGALRSATSRLAAHLRAHPHVPLDDIAWTLQTGRRAFAHRSFAVSTDHESAIAALNRADLTVRAAGPQPPVTFLFPAQGGQYAGMARELYDGQPAFREEFDRCADLAEPMLRFDLRRVLSPPPADDHEAAERLTSMAVAQPAVFAVEYALARLWMALGVLPDAVAGHSLGAYAAAAIAQALSLPDALTLVIARGRLLDGLDAGAMLAVPLPERELSPLLGGQLSMAAVNAADQCVVAGLLADITALNDQLAERGVDGRLLHISAAAHSHLTAPALAEFERVVSRVRLNAPAIPWISDRTGLPVTAREAQDPGYWVGHLRHTVRFVDTLATVLTRNDGPVLEVGPGRTLCALARRHPACRDDRALLASMPHAVESTDGPTVFATAAGMLWCSGVPIAWPEMHRGQRPHRVPLTTYPFERQRFRLDGAIEAKPAAEPDELTADGPVSARERALAGVFGDVLGLSEVGTHDNFFDLGGDSLLARRVVDQAARTLSLKLSIRMIFDEPTVAGLAKLIERS